MLPQEFYFPTTETVWWLLRSNCQGRGEACCLYTVAFVNRSVKIMYTLPQGTFWTFSHTLFTNRIVHEHIYSYVCHMGTKWGMCLPPRVARS